MALTAIALVLAPRVEPDPIVAVPQGSTRSVSMHAGRHQLTWEEAVGGAYVGDLHVDITAVDPATGSSAQVISRPGPCGVPSGNRERCGFGTLVAPTDGTYDVKVIVEDAKPGQGELRIHQRLGSPPHEYALLIATMAAFSILPALGAVVWFRSRRHRAATG